MIIIKICKPSYLLPSSRIKKDRHHYEGRQDSTSRLCPRQEHAHREDSGFSWGPLTQEEKNFSRVVYPFYPVYIKCKVRWGSFKNCADKGLGQGLLLNQSLAMLCNRLSIQSFTTFCNEGCHFSFFLGRQIAGSIIPKGGKCVASVLQGICVI